MYASRAQLVPSTLRLDTGAPVGLPGPYPQVFRAPKLLSGPVKIFSHGSPGSAGQKPVGCGYSQVDLPDQGSLQVLVGIPAGTFIKQTNVDKFHKIHNQK